jgi:sulfur carrier protein
MLITVNGKQLAVEDGMTVQGLLALQKIEPAAVAVEINLDIVPREDFAGRCLVSGDVVEVLRFVGGG